MRGLAALLFVLVPAVTLAAPAPTPAATSASPELPVLEGWRTERIPFPLDFAPTLPYKGHEDLRFSPGMFEPEAPDYFSYVFLWWLEGAPAFDAPTLERDLKIYFDGLAIAVGEAKKLPVKAGLTRATVERLDPRRFRAVVHTVDAFNGARPIELRLEIEVASASPDGHLAVYVMAAPAGANDPVWATLRRVVAGARAPTR